MAQTTFEQIDSPGVGRTKEMGGTARVVDALSRARPLIALVIAAAIFVLPLYWLFVTSLKSIDEVFADPLVWWPRQLVWSNYPEALQMFPFWRYLLNTITR